MGHTSVQLLRGHLILVRRLSVIMTLRGVLARDINNKIPIALIKMMILLAQCALLHGGQK